MPTPRAPRRFVVDRLRLQRYLAKPGDGRQQPRQPRQPANPANPANPRQPANPAIS